MNQVLDHLFSRWLAVALVGAGLLLGILLLWLRRRRRAWSLQLLLFSVTLALLGLGGLALPSAEAGAWVAGAAVGTLVLMLVVLLVTGHWWAPLGYPVGAVLLLGLGGLTAEALGQTLAGAGRFLLSLEPLQPWWLLLLLLVPLLFWFSFRSLAGLGPVRRWLALGLRSALLVCLALALAETHARHHDDSLTVLFLWDRSLSMPQDFEDGKDQREERLKKFINEAVSERGAGHERDRAGLIVFGRWPRLELPPATVRDLRLRRIISTVDDTHTDIAAAIKLALASFPEGSAKRIVLVSDGNQNLGDAEEQARIARQNGVEIDVVPVIADRQRQQEVLVERVEAPPVTEKDSRLPLRIVLRSYHPQVVVGQLKLIKISMDLKKDAKQIGEDPDKEGNDKGMQGLFKAQDISPRDEKGEPILIKLRQGLNTFLYQQPGAKEEQSYTYEAIFVPVRVEDPRGTIIQNGLPGDRLENNRASTNVVARGQRFVLLIEPEIGDHKLLVDRLVKAKSSLKVVSVTPKRLPRDTDQLALVLSRFDSVILANVPNEDLSEEQQKVIRSNTHDQGCGLVMIGGPQSFGAGGWQASPVEEALPVTCDLKSMKVEGKSGLVLIMHASEMAEGNFWQKKIARLAIEKLSAMDMVGLLYYDWTGGGHKWHIPFQQIGQQRAQLLGRLDSMQPGDMPDAEPSLKMAHDALITPAHQLGTKHIIFISDGDHWSAPVALLQKIKVRKITCTTVCITTHGAAEVTKMAQVARLTGGRAYHVTNPNQLPEIYIKESRLISQSFVYDKTFDPQLRFRAGPTEGLPKDLGPLHGFVRTTPRPSALVEVPIQTPKIGGYTFPILAYWHYGLGKAVAFTSDARTIEGSKTRFWDHDWATSEMYGRFWEQVVDWSLRAVETGKHLNMTTEQRDGKVRVIIEARGDDKVPLTDLMLRAGVTSPSLKPADPRQPELKFEQKNAGVYEAEFKAEDIGAYFIHVSARWKGKDGKEVSDSVRTGVTIPYSPEFAELESNPALLDRLREMTGGKTFADEGSALRDAARTGEVFRPLPALSVSLQPIWHWLVLLAGVGLFFDVAVRRIALEPAKVTAWAEALWARLRGRGAAVQTAQFLDRLQSRKAQVGESLEKTKATRRFEGGDAPTAPPPAAAAGPPGAGQPPRPAQSPQPRPEKEQEAGDYASRLLRAKKRVWKDRDKEQE